MEKEGEMIPSWKKVERFGDKGMDALPPHKEDEMGLLAPNGRNEI